MPELTRSRYIPPRRAANDHARSAPIPRWILREAGPAFDLTPIDIMVLCLVADNLDETGAARLSVTLIARRANVARNTARSALDRLIAENLIFELDEPAQGRMMRFALAPEMPWSDR